MWSLEESPCIACGAPSGGGTFCTQCGAKTRETCATCGTSCRASAIFCTQCGNPFVPSDGSPRAIRRSLPARPAPSSPPPSERLVLITKRPAEGLGTPAAFNSPPPATGSYRSGVLSSFLHAVWGFLAIAAGYAGLTVGIHRAAAGRPDQSALIQTVGLLVSLGVVLASAWWIGRQASVAFGVGTLLLFIVGVPLYIFRAKRNQRPGRRGAALEAYPPIKVALILAAFALVIFASTNTVPERFAAASISTTATPTKTAIPTAGAAKKGKPKPKPTATRVPKMPKSS